MGHKNISFLYPRGAKNSITLVRKNNKILFHFRSRQSFFYLKTNLISFASAAECVLDSTHFDTYSSNWQTWHEPTLYWHWSILWPYLSLLIFWCFPHFTEWMVICANTNSKNYRHRILGIFNFQGQNFISPNAKIEADFAERPIYFICEEGKQQHFYFVRELGKDWVGNLAAITISCKLHKYATG